MKYHALKINMQNQFFKALFHVLNAIDLLEAYSYAILLPFHAKIIQVYQEAGFV